MDLFLANEELDLEEKIFTGCDPDIGKGSIKVIEDNETIKLLITVENGLQLSKTIFRDEMNAYEMKEHLLEFVKGLDSIISKKLLGKLRCKYCKQNPCKCTHI